MNKQLIFLYHTIQSMVKSQRGTLRSKRYRANVKTGRCAFFKNVVYVGIITVHHCHSPRVGLRAEHFWDRYVLNDLVILDML